MEALARQLSERLFPGFVLCLEGDLGAGKTTFTQFLGKGMGITDTINSPTFNILKIYEGSLPLYHMDVYRLDGIGADYDLEDYIYGDGVCVIEWYHHILESLPDERLIIEIDILSDTARQLRMEANGVYEDILEALGD
jgi:tRNA threonylcarbamoyladenosine biosynthesis protein TsaE